MRTTRTMDTMDARRGLLLVVLLGLFTVGGVARAAEIEMLQTPCRLYDSRNIGGVGMGSKVSTATIETWNRVSGLSAGAVQGGETGCGVPPGSTGVILNVTVYAPTGAGYGRLWAHSFPEPLPTSISFASGQTDESTGLVVATGTFGLLDLHSVYASAHYIVDVAGFVSGDGDNSPPAPRLRRFHGFIYHYVPPPSPYPAGIRFIVGVGAYGGPFAGQDNMWAVSTDNGWTFEYPIDGDLAFSAPDGKYYSFRVAAGSTWTEVGQ